MRSRVLEVEKGICQHCGLHAHDLFMKVRDAPPTQRKDMLENTWLAQLSLKQVGNRRFNDFIGSQIQKYLFCSEVMKFEHTVIFRPFFNKEQ